MKIEIGQAYRDKSTGFVGLARGYTTRGRLDRLSAECVVMLAKRLQPDGKCGEVRHVSASTLVLVPASLAT